MQITKDYVERLCGWTQLLVCRKEEGSTHGEHTTSDYEQIQNVKKKLERLD